MEERLRGLQACIAKECSKGREGAADAVAEFKRLQDTSTVGGDSSAAEFEGDVEIAFRNVLMDFIDACVQRGTELTNEQHFPFRHLLDLAIGVAQHPDGVGRRVPFLLIEDVFDVLVVGQIEEIWEVIEAREQEIFSLFGPGKGKLPMLKICNALLRRLSKTYNTALCGRIMLYLARNWDLSEPSAINKARLANVANKTTYEEEKSSRANRQELEKQKRELKLDTMEDDSLSKQDAMPLDYSLYRTFWGLQEYLSDPVKTTTTGEAWEKFTAAAKRVLQAFEGFSVMDRDVSSGAEGERGPGGSSKRRRVALQESAGEASSAYLGCKFLTNSRLFRLQLHDPLIRTQVLAQVMMVLNYAKMTLPAGGEPRPGAAELTKHARKLIKATPPSGPQELNMLDTALDRERTWHAWKERRCSPAIEKPPAKDPLEVRMSPEVSKALHEAEKMTTMVSQQRKAFFDVPFSLPRSVDMDAITAVVGRENVTFDNYVVPKVEEANDPENAIEESDHPKNRPVFCWRALRLASKSNACRALSSMDNGSLEALFREAGMGHLMGLPAANGKADNDAMDADEASSVKSASSLRRG